MCNNHMDTPLVARSNVHREVLIIRDDLLEFLNNLFQYSHLDDFVKSPTS